MPEKRKAKSNREAAAKQKRLQLMAVFGSLLIGGVILWRASLNWINPPPATAFVAFAIAIGVLTFGEGLPAVPKRAKVARRAAPPEAGPQPRTPVEKKLARELAELRKENERLKQSLARRRKK